MHDAIFIKHGAFLNALLCWPCLAITRQYETFGTFDAFSQGGRSHRFILTIDFSTPRFSERS